MINTNLIDQFLEKKFPNAQSSIFRDLSLNFKKLLEDSALEPQERMLNLAAIATSLHDEDMQKLAMVHLTEMGLTPEQTAEAFEVAGIMGMLNTYYKFKGYLDPQSLENYARAGLRMQSLSKPQNGKEKFEMMALAVSAINGCPTCISSHEKALIHAGTSFEKIHDIARLASVCKGLNSLQNARF
jgi:alkyl hydroperoxide reductase subunit D